MSSEGIYHYVYRITNLVESKHYYGKRSSKIEPHLDLGKKYFSSSKDKNFIKDQKENPQNYKYKVVFICKSARRAIELETTLHDMFDVGRNQSFYNKVKQNGNGFDSTGIVVVKNSLGETFSVSVDDPRFISGELKHVNVGKITVKNSLGETFSVSKDDPGYISGELVGANAGNVIVKDIHGNTFSVSVDDPRYISGELKHAADGYKHTSEAKRKMSDRNKGTKLVYNIELDKSMRLKQEEAINLVKSNTGWKLGRKPKDVIY